ncbi:kelch-like protein [Anaeramoeba flamelloides]|uniref:Kelch-like protein n=1 Tax=Anaeramoeba flamelloides TaxID=1746091 RepID=A0AAV7YNU4_9EUKA|nr:kelch-like protein [Anaeramoeba flamelloides]
MEISGIKVHSSMLKLRTDLLPQYFKSQLEKASLNQEDYQEFVQYIYGQDHKINNESVKKSFGVLGLHSGTLPDFGQQLINKFYQNNNNEKDFAILVPDPEEPEEVEAVNIHKIILQARSGLFRNMFNNINDNISQVKEYSGKSIDTIEVIVKYLYTNTLEITADMDPQIILEELQDAQEYFQINPKYNFVNELHQLSLRSKQN